MENATKALLIAGAVLIVILLIGVGMLIFNSSTAPVDQAVTQMDAQARSIFNAQFENYSGSQKGASVRQLLSAVISSNASYDTPVTVKYTGTGTATGLAGVKTASDDSTKISAARTDINLSTSYTVTLIYTSGLVSSVEFK